MGIAVETAWRVIESPVGPLAAAATDRGVCRLGFGPGGSAGESQHLDHLAEELKAYFEGRLRRFTAALDPSGTSFRRSVWAQLLEIPYGRTISYDELARRVGRAKGQRAVGQANGANPIAIVVPCHRVIAKDGTLGGYGGGLERKRWLLEHEARCAGAAGATLFSAAPGRAAGASRPIRPALVCSRC